MDMDYAIGVLLKEREEIVTALKSGQKNRLKDLAQLDKAIHWLNLLQGADLDLANRYQLEALPFIEGYGGFTCYRLMIDNETDDVNAWVEYKNDQGESYSLQLGDYILRHKHY